MAFFGGQAKTGTDPKPVDTAEERREDLPELPDPRDNTVIAKDITLTGSLSGEGVVQIEGTVEGEVKLKGYVIVTATGVVKGPVEADVLRIAGSVMGSVNCHDHLQLERTGTIEGDVVTGSFVIENGGRLNGRTTMEKTAEPAVPRYTPPEDTAGKEE